jgi:NADH:ubiquinone oxidoreductase subunit B-like Fe-S oxidoreductase
MGPEVFDLPVSVRDRLLRHGVHGDGLLALRRRPLRRGFQILPRQADVLFVVGTISHKMAPVMKRIYDQMAEPKWVVAFGVCTCTGGFYDNYATVMGIDTILPVDVYIPGCPPRPEYVLDGLIKLQARIQNQHDTGERPAPEPRPEFAV